MLELKNIAGVITGLSIQPDPEGVSPFVRLSDVADVKAGRIPTLARGRIPTVARAARVRKGDLVVAARGDATEVSLAVPVFIDAFVSVDLYLIRPDPHRVSAEYLAAFIDQPEAQAQLAAGKQGSGLARLNKATLDNLLVPLPPIDKQRAIGAIAQCVWEAGELEGKIAVLRGKLGRGLVREAFSILN